MCIRVASYFLVSLYSIVECCGFSNVVFSLMSAEGVGSLNYQIDAERKLVQFGGGISS